MFVAFLPILALQVKVEGPMSAVYVKVLDVNNQFFQGRSMQESAPSRFFGWLVMRNQSELAWHGPEPGPSNYRKLKSLGTSE